MTTIYDIARRAHVSIATVSKVLSGRPYVSAKTRARVLDVVSELNYVPNAAARTLASERTGVIGVVITYDPHGLFSDPNLLQILYGIDTQVNHHDYALLLSTARSAEDRNSAFRRLLGARRVDGVLVDTGRDDEGVDLLVEQGYPCVVLGYTSLDLPYVHPDDYRGACLLTEHLLKLGHSRIGVIDGPSPSSLAMQARLRGHQDMLTEWGVPVVPEYKVYGTFHSVSGYAGAGELMKLDPPPTAIFAFNDRMALGAIQWLREHGDRVPEDISVAGFDDIAGAEQFDPPLTTIRQIPRDTGQRAASILFDLIAEQQIEQREVVLPVHLVERRSTAPSVGRALQSRVHLHSCAPSGCRWSGWRWVQPSTSS
jgi:DNA-binding LacI/PurR family transcriptional regulator